MSDQKTSSLIRHVPCLHDHHPHPQPLSRTAGHPHPQPLSRTAGEGCVNAVSVTGIGSPLLRSSPPSSPLVEEKGGQGGKVSSTTSPLPLPLWWERKAEGEEHNLPPSSPAAWERTGARGEGEGPPALRAPSPPAPLPHCGRGVCKRGIGDRRRIAPAPLVPPSSPAAWERTGARGEGEGMNDLAKLYCIFNLRSQSFAIVKISTEDWLT